MTEAAVAGIDAEGLYRVSGFHSDIEAIKLSLDKGKQLPPFRYSFLNLFFFVWKIKTVN